jgi:hypothetical protein
MPIICNLIQKVPEFAEKSIICLDADAAQQIKDKNFKTVSSFTWQLAARSVDFRAPVQPAC